MAQTKWILDPAHSEILFKVKHLMISTVTGYFRKFDLEVITEENDFTKASGIVFTADIDSIDTKNDQRDAHLKSADFFNAEEHGLIRFAGTGIHVEDDESKLKGELTIKGVTHPVKVKVEFGGIAVDPYGQTKAGFSVKGKISRADFGLTWNAVTEAGNVVVDDNVKFSGEIQLIRQG